MNDDKMMLIQRIIMQGLLLSLAEVKTLIQEGRINEAIDVIDALLFIEND